MNFPLKEIYIVSDLAFEVKLYNTLYFSNQLGNGWREICGSKQKCLPVITALP